MSQRILTETGVVLLLDGKFWGIAGEFYDGLPVYDWVDYLDDAVLKDPRSCRNPAAMPHYSESDIEELNQGHLVFVRKTITYELLDIRLDHAP